MSASHHAFRSGAIALLLVAVGTGAAAAQTPGATPAEQIDRAVLAAPESMRADATVLGYGGEPRVGDALTVLRRGTNGILCLADDPSDDRFHVACYHESMDPYMAMGRRLRAAGESRDAVMAARLAAVEAGQIEAPAAALWSLTSPSDVDPDAGPGEEARRLSVVYVPFAEADELGLPTRPDGDSPWLMLPGTPWAHIMISR